MHRVNQINLQFADAKPKKASRKAVPHDDVIVNLGLDKTMSAKGNEIRMDISKICQIKWNCLFK
jgi:hypothetical protein